MSEYTSTSTILENQWQKMDSININSIMVPISRPSSNKKAKRYYFIAKRSFDIFISTIAIILLSPLFLIVALLIRLDSKGPIFFSQLRVGKRGKEFKMWKFRSMYIDAEQRQQELMKNNEMQGGVLFKIKQDPRVTRVGRILRKFSLDELPQLWNVWRGDMSLVGPRPPIPTEVQEYTCYQRKRLEATPGITCIWQISGRSDIPFPQQVELDLIYIRHQSLKCDLVILLKTVPAVLKARGAY
jgi:exopolysaccharide biosynthesis polyprenyl glycosylphosphotransferase